ncbi:MAG: hypothetical protein LM574_05190, partial [Archaeoglobus sp.]|nr:hypothetical protein [Archaeoglobus sp.]
EPSPFRAGRRSALKATTFTCRFKSQAHPADLIKPAGYQVHSETSELLLLDKKDAKACPF